MPQQQPHSYGKALYYPYTRVRNTNWLKSALLYWDGIRRIVPESVPIFDEDEVRVAIDAGLVEDIPTNDDTPYILGAKTRFEELLLPALAEPATSSTVVSTQLAQILPYHPIPSSRIYPEKIHSSLRSDLLNLNLAHIRGNRIELDGFIGGLYMLCLASEVSEKIGSPLVTDTSEYAPCSEYLTFGQLADVNDDPETRMLLRLGISLPAPHDLAYLPMSEVVTFHNERVDERQRFRQAIESIGQAAANINDPIMLMDYLDGKRAEIQSALDDHQKALQELKIKNIGSFLRVSSPALPGLVVSQANHELGVFLTVLGLGFGFVEWWAERRGRERKAKLECPWHYLWSTDQLLPSTP